MKAYLIGLNSNPDAGNEIVFAKNVKEAKKNAYNLSFTDEAENYIDIYVKRYPTFDDMENLSGKEFTRKKWREGWWFFQDGYPDWDGSTDEDFDRWYKNTFEE